MPAAELVSSSRGLTLVSFPASHLAVLRTTPPTTAAQALAMAPDAEAVLDGPMASWCPNVVHDYSTYTCGDPYYLLIDRLTGVVDPGLCSTCGLTFALKGGEVSAARGEHYPAGADLVVQTYPSLVEDGRAMQVQEGGIKWRAAMGILSSGRMFFAVGEPGTMPDFAAALVRAGAQWAGYTDGGGSARLATRTRWWGSSENRRLASWIVVRSTPRPGSEDSVGTVGIALGAVAVAVLAWWAVTRR